MVRIMSELLNRIYSHGPIWFQNLAVTLYGAKIHRERYGRKFTDKLEEFERNEWLSQDELVDYQNRKLERLIRHAYDHVPYYQLRMNELKLKPADIRTVSDLYKLPVLTRAELKKNLPALKARNYPRWQVRAGHTSGTTGSPLEIFWDNEMCVVNNVVDWRQKKWAGLRYGDRIALLVGRVVVRPGQTQPPFWRTNLIHHQLFFSSFHLHPENLRHYAEKLKEFKPRALEAYPSTAYILARYLNQRNEIIPLECVLTSSETLYPHYREEIEKAFGCPVFDYYGQAERVVFATECSAHHGHHVNSDYGILEILKDGKSPAAPGETGWMVATSLHNFAVPLIRYVTNDLTAWKTEECPCGRKFPLMEDITTKAEDFITTRDGKYISSSVLTHPFKDLHHVRESQIIQPDREHILVKIVKDAGYTDDETKKLLEGLSQRLGAEMKIEIQFTDLIPRTKAGKLRWVISEVPLEF